MYVFFGIGQGTWWGCVRMQKRNMINLVKILGQMVYFANSRSPTYDCAVGGLVMFGVGDDGDFHEGVSVVIF